MYPFKKGFWRKRVRSAWNRKCCDLGFSTGNSKSLRIFVHTLTYRAEVELWRCGIHSLLVIFFMKTFFGTSSKRTASVAGIVVLFISAFAIQSGFVHGKAALRPTAGNKPVAGATVIITKNNSNTVIKTVTDSTGTFHLANAMQGTPYTFTFTLPGSTTPFQAWANFNKMRGLLAGGLNASVAATGPISIMSNGSIKLSTSFSGTISGTLTK